jgi:hypothetical protein
MLHSLDKSVVIDALKTLDRLDRERKIFGSQGHNYQLNPPVPEALIDAFEDRHRLRLPEDYRYFMTQIGSGGAGPFWGGFPFGMQDRGHEFGPLEDGFLGDLSAVFPHDGPWNLPESFWEKRSQIPPDATPEEQHRIYEECDRLDGEHYWNPQLMRGAIPICHRGCALRQWLVVQGPLKGTIWDDDRVDRKGVRPLLDEQSGRVTFAAWYVSWLDQASAEASAMRKRD